MAADTNPQGQPQPEELKNLPSISVLLPHQPFTTDDPCFTFIGSHQLSLTPANSTKEAKNQSPTSTSVIGLTLPVFRNQTSSIQPIFSNGKPAVILRNSDKQQLIKGLKYVLIAKFSHGRPTLANLKLFFSKQRLKGSLKFSIFDSKHVILDCEFFDDFVTIWLKQVWVIHGYTARIFKWTADFHPSKESTIFPVWFHLPALPLYLYEEGQLLLIAQAIGEPLYIDCNNINRTKLSYASICVEFDVLNTPVDELWIAFDDGFPLGIVDGFVQKVVYQNVPSFCSFCNHLGHTIDVCKRKADTIIVQKTRHVESEVLQFRDSRDGYGLKQSEGLASRNSELVQGYAGNTNCRKNTGQQEPYKGGTDLLHIDNPLKEKEVKGNTSGEDTDNLDNLEEGEIRELVNVLEATSSRSKYDALEGMNQLLLQHDLITELSEQDGSSSNASLSEIVASREDIRHGEGAVGSSPKRLTHEGKKLDAGSPASLLLDAGIAAWNNAVTGSEIVANAATSEVSDCDSDPLVPAAGQNTAVMAQLDQKVIETLQKADLLEHCAAGIRCTNSSSNIKQQDQVGRASDGLRGGQVNSNEDQLGEGTVADGNRNGILKPVPSESAAGNAHFAVVSVTGQLHTQHQTLMDEDIKERADQKQFSKGSKQVDGMLVRTIVQIGAGEEPNLLHTKGHTKTGLYTDGQADAGVVLSDTGKSAEGETYSSMEAVTETPAVPRSAVGKSVTVEEGEIAEEDTVHATEAPMYGGDTSLEQNLHTMETVEGEADSRTAGQKHDRADSDVLVEEERAASAHCSAVSKDTQQGAGAAREGCWADLVEEEHEQQLAREHNDILEWDAAQVKAFVHKQIEEIKQEIGQIEPKIRDAAKEEKKEMKQEEIAAGEAERVRKSTAQKEKQLARELKFARERKNLKEYFRASAEKINSDFQRKRSEKKENTTWNSFKYGEG